MKEPKPSRPAGQDGVYTDPLLDGAWTEYPKDGAYTLIGYFKEVKPFRRTTITKEALPRRPAGTDGAYTDPAQDGAWGEYPKDGAYTEIGYHKEMKPFQRR